MKKKIIKSFDIETTALSPFNGGSIFSFSLGDYYGNVKVYRMDYGNKFDTIHRQILINEINNPHNIIVAHNMKFEILYCKYFDYLHGFNAEWHDTMILAKVLYNLEPNYDLGSLCYKYCGFSEKVDEIVGKYNNYKEIPKKLFNQYQINDGLRPIIIFRALYPYLQKDKRLQKVYYNELEFAKNCVDLELYGFKIDKTNCNSLIKELQNDLYKIEDQVAKINGRYINILSPIDIKEFLFKTLNLKPEKLTKKKNISTNKDVLLQLRESNPAMHNSIDLVIKYRAYSNGIKAIQNYIKFSDSNLIIHPTINPIKAVTKRPSCSKPNLLNISKEGVLKNLFPVPARKCFVARKNRKIWFVDYSGIQLRLIIDVAHETVLIDRMMHGEDLHEIATELYYAGVKFCYENEYEKYKNYFKSVKYYDIKKLSLPNDVWSTYRGAGKNTHFAMPFGGQDIKLCETLKLPFGIGIKGIERYKKAFPKVAFFSKIFSDKAREKGYLETPFGSKVYIPYSDFHVAGNYLIQMTEAEVMKIGFNRLANYFRIVHGCSIKLLLPIYDEFVFETPLFKREYELRIYNDVKKLTTRIKEIKIPLDVDLKMTSTNWREVKKINFEGN